MQARDPQTIQPEKENSMAIVRKGQAEWKGGVPEGSGSVSVQSGAFTAPTASSRAWKTVPAPTRRS